MNSTAAPELLRVQGLVKRFDGILATEILRPPFLYCGGSCDHLCRGCS